MTSPESTAPADASLRREWLHFARYYLGNRWVLLTLGSLVLVIGAAFNWGWLVAAGIAPLIISLAPCAIMCAIGLCSLKKTGGSSEPK
ncbi:MAG: hypothetical protein HY659_02465 [Rhizobiales bacterium]|nr:hypothetical protein [Hyphomicrobiales bacterium]